MIHNRAVCVKCECVSAFVWLSTIYTHTVTVGQIFRNQLITNDAHDDIYTRQCRRHACLDCRSIICPAISLLCRQISIRSNGPAGVNCIFSVSQKNPPWGLVAIFPKRLGIFQLNFMCLLRVPIYSRLQVFIQLFATLTKLCHIKCDQPACVSVDGGHFEHMVVALNMA